MPAPLFRRDWSIRVIGFVLSCVGVACLYTLFDRQVAPTGYAGFSLAAGGFLGCTWGSMLVSLGDHIHDRVVLSRRWASRLAPAGPAEEDPEREGQRIAEQRLRGALIAVTTASAVRHVASFRTE